MYVIHYSSVVFSSSFSFRTKQMNMSDAGSVVTNNEFVDPHSHMAITKHRTQKNSLQQKIIIHFHSFGYVFATFICIYCDYHSFLSYS